MGRRARRGTGQAGGRGRGGNERGEGGGRGQRQNRAPPALPRRRHRLGSGALTSEARGDRYGREHGRRVRFAFARNELSRGEGARGGARGARRARKTGPGWGGDCVVCGGAKTGPKARGAAWPRLAQAPAPTPPPAGGASRFCARRAVPPARALLGSRVGVGGRMDGWVPVYPKLRLMRGAHLALSNKLPKKAGG